MDVFYYPDRLDAWNVVFEPSKIFHSDVISMAARIPRAEGPPASPRISEHKGVTTAETMTVLDKQHKADGLKVTQRLKHFNRKLVFIMM